MFRNKRWIGMMAAALILAVTIAGVAMAADQQAGSDKTSPYQAFITKLAANLGVDQDKVTAALDATKKQILDEAVAFGKLTQEQADKIAARKDGSFGFFGGIHDRKGAFGDRTAGMAQAIGITEDELKSEMQSGKKLSDILADQGITEDQFKQKMLDIRKEALAQAVADGKLTQEQADKIAAGNDGKMGWDKKGAFGVRMGRNTADMAKAIGITEDELKTEMQSGQKLSDILADHGLTEDQYQQKMLEIKKAELAQAVTGGKLTQDQADKMLQRMEQFRNNTSDDTDK